MPIDPVCGAFVPASDAAAMAEVRGHRYHFCSQGCCKRFTAPERQRHRLRRLALLALAGGAVLAALTHLSVLEAGMQAWILLGLGTAVQVAAGWPFYRGVHDALAAGTANVDVLIAAGTTTAWLVSVVEVVLPELLVAGALVTYFEVSALVLGALLVGRILEQRLRRDADDQTRRLLDLQPDNVRVITEDGTRTVPVEEVDQGTQFVVEPGERIPLDGVVVRGKGAVDEKMVTGEALPVDKRPGDKVLGGTRNEDGELTVRATHDGKASTVAKIVELMEQARNAAPPIQRTVDRVTAWYVPVVILAAAGVAVAWWALGQPLPFVVGVLVATLLVGCPSPLGLATPSAMEAAVARAGEDGLLLKDGAFVEGLQKVDMVVFDKTGTLTEGRPTMTDLHAVDGDDDGLLARAAALEQASDHPLARAAVAEARERDLEFGSVDDFESIAGEGVRGTVDGTAVAVGNTTLMEEQGVDPSPIRERTGKWQDAGRTVVLVAVDGELAGALAFEDELKPEARAAVAALQDRGIDVGLMTGDHVRTAHAIGRELGLGKRRTFAGLTPDDKVALVKALQDGDRTVAMVGDGINDAPALAAADIGLAVGSGADVTVEGGDIVLLRDDLEDVPGAIELGEETLGTIRRNLGLAMAYNAVLLPLAAIGLIGPVLAGAAAALSTAPIALSSARVRRR